jgi:hypothetical protein
MSKDVRDHWIDSYELVPRVGPYTHAAKVHLVWPGGREMTLGEHFGRTEAEAIERARKDLGAWSRKRGGAD